MSQIIRRLNDPGIEAFRQYLSRAREGHKEPVPVGLLNDEATSEPLAHQSSISPLAFENMYVLGLYISKALRTFDRQAISHDHRLWSWLALFFFDQLCPEKPDGTRSPLEDAVYLLAPTFQHTRYYRHAVRTPWIAVMAHGENARVLLVTVSGGTRSDIFEQLASRQNLFENQTVIAGASALYFNEVAGKPKRGAGGKGAGSARRLATIVTQLDLTYDLVACDVKTFLSLLPKEFSKFMPTLKIAPQ